VYVLLKNMSIATEPLLPGDVENKHAPENVRFIVTGFGPFGCVQENPSTILAEGLVAFLSSMEVDKSIFTYLASVTNTLVIETSAQAASDAIDQFFTEEKNRHDGASVVILHLGVRYEGELFQVEEFAYNDASFRIPDERGFQPHKQSILGDNKEIGLPYKTLLNVPNLVDDVNQLSLADIRCKAMPAAVVSTDPGRFVCNYIYCYSMNTFQCCDNRADASSKFRCLFLHVPPFKIISMDQQFMFLSRLMRSIYYQVTTTR
jgi:pyroglutamyl-peptidase